MFYSIFYNQIANIIKRDNNNSKMNNNYVSEFNNSLTFCQQNTSPVTMASNNNHSLHFEALPFCSDWTLLLSKCQIKASDDQENSMSNFFDFKKYLPNISEIEYSFKKQMIFKQLSTSNYPIYQKIPCQVPLLTKETIESNIFQSMHQ